MKQKEGFVLREICGEKVIMGDGLKTINFGKLVSLNDSAAWLWKKAAELGDFTIDQLADEMCNRYIVDREKVLADVTTIVNEWKDLELVG